MAAIGPVYANHFMPMVPQKGMGAHAHHNHQAHSKTHAHHGSSKHESAKTDVHLLCLEHCLQFLNTPCLVPTELNLEPNQIQETCKQTPLAVLPVVLYPGQKMFSGADPPTPLSGLIIGKSLSPLLLQTSRLRL